MPVPTTPASCKTLVVAGVMSLLLVLAACTQSGPPAASANAAVGTAQEEVPPPAKPATDTPPQASQPPAPDPAMTPRDIGSMGDAVPPQRAADPSKPTPPASPASGPLACNSDSECTIKNVGSCCGAKPACVHVDAPVDPEGVTAKCARDGMASICGFEEITSCQCVNHECQGKGSALEVH